MLGRHGRYSAGKHACVSTLTPLPGRAQALSFVGAAVNVARLPERLLVVPLAERGGKEPAARRSPGLFDYWLNSHQIVSALPLAHAPADPGRMRGDSIRACFGTAVPVRDPRWLPCTAAACPDFLAAGTCALQLPATRARLTDLVASVLR